MTPIYCELVADDRRVQHAATLFGLDFPLRLEPCVFGMASRLSSTYDGGYWLFHSLSNGGYYMSPDGPSTFAVVCENGFSSSVSADAFGLTVCLYAYSHLSSACADGLGERCSQHYHLLRDFALEHAESDAILRAID